MKKQFMKQYSMVQGCQQGNEEEEEEEDREDSRTSLSIVILCKQFWSPHLLPL